jgi:catechol 2,3-dioxygenase-like lactoylglutathione lyase family enzyme
MTKPNGPVFSQLNLVISDMQATIAFWRRLGLSPEVTGAHATADLPGGLHIEWDTAEFAARWDSGSHGAVGGGTVFGFAVASRRGVDDLYGELTSAGYRGRQVPYDAFWGSRYAIVEDPDGHPVGLMSPMEDEYRSGPPGQAPAS